MNGDQKLIAIIVCAVMFAMSSCSIAQDIYGKSSIVTVTKGCDTP